MTWTLRPMRRDDVEAALQIWNDDCPHDTDTASGLERRLFDHRDSAEDGLTVACEGDDLLGFVCCVARGRRHHRKRPTASLKALCIGHRAPDGVADALLEAAEQYARACDRNVLRVVQYGRHGGFFPGMDVRYERKIEFLLGRGFRRKGEIVDVAADLRQFTPSPDQQEAQRRVAEAGIQILPYDPSMLDMMRPLAEAVNTYGWFHEGWEERRKRRTNTFVAIQGEQMVGYADYRPGEVRGSFGTTAVMPDMRGRGIGSCLLVASMLKLKELGTPEVVAVWANAPFYLRNGWHIIRTYAELEKPLTE